MGAAPTKKRYNRDEKRTKGETNVDDFDFGDLSPLMGGGGRSWNEPDYVLTYILTALVNAVNMEISMTLTVNGVLMTGDVVSERVYLQQATELLKSQMDFDDPEMPPEVRQSLEAMLDLTTLAEFDAPWLRDPDDVDDDEDEDSDLVEPPMPVEYLHLRAPIILAGEPPVNFGEASDIIVRIRMASIDSWMLGRISPDGPDLLDDFLSNGNGDVKH